MVMTAMRSTARTTSTFASISTSTSASISTSTSASRMMSGTFVSPYMTRMKQEYNLPFHQL